MNDEVCSIQLIDSNGEINVSELERFVKAVKLAECRYSYAVVSIMGPQSSGKSTLLNQLFHTNFTEMNALEGRSQTTKGIWLAKCVGIEPTTVVMDLEGTDGSERGEDDTAFERQSALFAWAVSDIVVINMSCQDIGKENAANKPLLSTLFQAMMCSFDPRRTTLLFVIRDETETPLHKLEAKIREDIEKIWKDVTKPKKYERTPISEFFRVEVKSLPHYKYEKDKFKEQVAKLRQNFDRSTTPSLLACDWQPVVQASEFSLRLQKIWKAIRENKDLVLPSRKVMAATVRCREISDEKLSQFTDDECWIEIREAVKSCPISGFGERISNLIDSYMGKYDRETKNFHEGTRSQTRRELERGVLEHVRPAYEDMLRHLRSKALDTFEHTFRESLKSGEGLEEAFRNCTKAVLRKFDDGCADAKVRQASCDPSKIRDDLLKLFKSVSDIARLQALVEDLSAKHRARPEDSSPDERARLEALSAQEARLEEMKREFEERRNVSFIDVAFGLIGQFVMNVVDFFRSLNG